MNIKWAIVAAVLAAALPAPAARAEVTAEQVEQSLRDGIRFLKSQQRPDGSWDEYEGYPKGTTCLITLALLSAGVPPDDPQIARSIDYIMQSNAEGLRKVYCVALQTMVMAAVDPERFRVRIAENAEWLERAQIKPGNPGATPGGWSYEVVGFSADNSNTQYALLGLNAASEAGVPVSQEVWRLARDYWEGTQKLSGAWSYNPNPAEPPTASMTTAGISSLVITGQRRLSSREILAGDQIRNCGEGGVNPNLQRALDWMASQFRVDQNVPRAQTWKYYYLYGLERAGRLSGQRYFGNHDWYREGAEHLIQLQDPLTGKWSRGSGAGESKEIIASAFSLLFLSKGRSPILINKLQHGQGDNWDNHREGVRQLVDVVSQDWKTYMTFQTVNPDFRPLEDLMLAPICFLNYHQPIGLAGDGKQTLKQYVEQGGFIFAEACCGKPEHDQGFRDLVAEIFPRDQGYELRPLSEEHPVWRSRYQLDPGVHPLWGIELGCRTVLIYSPADLSGYWSHIYAQPDNPAVIKARRVGQNVIDYATGREPPPERLVRREIVEFKADPPRRGALYIGKLRHAGGWNVAPLAVPNLTSLLRDRLGYEVVLNHRELLPGDPNLANHPLVYVHGRAGFTFSDADITKLREHLDPGGGTFLADAACGAEAFDTSFRAFCKQLFPDKELEPIPPDDDLLSNRVGFDLSEVEYTKAAGGNKGRPRLEGIKVDGHWAVIYSPLDLGCALERQQGLDCKGYTHQSALRIAANVVIYSTLP